MIDRWLSLPVPALVLTVAGFYGASALLLIYLCFGRATGAWVQSFKGVVAPFIGGIVVILGILIGFLANDVWDRNRRAASTVRSEAASLLSLHDLVAASGLPDARINCAIRDYVIAVTEKEWPSMAEGEASAEAEAAQDQLLRIVAQSESVPNGGPAFNRLLVDTALNVRQARDNRLALSADYSESEKWASVLLFAVMGQISVAAVHLERARPHIAAMVIFTIGLIIVIGLIAAYEQPFNPPLSVSPEPLINILKIVPNS
jgi:Protein of unknown function (DUF4239)